MALDLGVDSVTTLPQGIQAARKLGNACSVLSLLCVTGAALLLVVICVVVSATHRCGVSTARNKVCPIAELCPVLNAKNIRIANFSVSDNIGVSFLEFFEIGCAKGGAYNLRLALGNHPIVYHIYKIIGKHGANLRNSRWLTRRASPCIKIWRAVVTDLLEKTNNFKIAGRGFSDVGEAQGDVSVAGIYLKRTIPTTFHPRTLIGSRDLDLIKYEEAGQAAYAKGEKSETCHSPLENSHFPNSAVYWWIEFAVGFGAIMIGGLLFFRFGVAVGNGKMALLGCLLALLGMLSMTHGRVGGWPTFPFSVANIDIPMIPL